jgi:drug/metabolite transporter (DMT)-like permease
MGAMTTSHNLSRSAAIWVTLASAALFGVATPAVKPFIQGIAPQLAAGVLYIGMGIGLLVAYLARGAPPANVAKHELKWLFISLVCGGVVAPWLIFWGLSHATATATSLLANTEVVFSTVLARFWFGERYSNRLFIGVACIVGGAMVLGGLRGGMDPLPALAIVCACAFWGIDNNAMRLISHADASFVGSAKGLIAGATNVLIALGWGAVMPPTGPLLGVLGVGVICYGASFGLYVQGLRVLGAARTSAFYGTAPFAGALMGVGLLHEPVTVNLLTSALLMGAGVWLHAAEPHGPIGPHVVDMADDPGL